jgi:hypothetical protein
MIRQRKVAAGTADRLVDPDTGFTAVFAAGPDTVRRLPFELGRARLDCDAGRAG